MRGLCLLALVGMTAAASLDRGNTCPFDAQALFDKLDQLNQKCEGAGGRSLLREDTEQCPDVAAFLAESTGDSCVLNEIQDLVENELPDDFWECVDEMMDEVKYCADGYLDLDPAVAKYAVVDIAKFNCVQETLDDLNCYPPADRRSASAYPRGSTYSYSGSTNYPMGSTYSYGGSTDAPRGSTWSYSGSSIHS